MLAARDNAQRKYDYITVPLPDGEWDREPVRRQAPPSARTRAQVVERLHPAQLQARKKTVVNCLYILTCFALLVLLISRYAVVSSVHLENLALEQEIENLELQVGQLQLELDTEGNIQEVQTIAEKELGMHFPDNSQIRYVHLPDDEQPVEETAKEAPDFFSDLWQRILRLFE